MYYTPPNVILLICSILAVIMYFNFRVENSVDPDPMVILLTCSILAVIMSFSFRVKNSVDPDQMASSEAI